jgi:hypothetical protein
MCECVTNSSNKVNYHMYLIIVFLKKKVMCQFPFQAM